MSPVLRRRERLDSQPKPPIPTFRADSNLGEDQLWLVVVGWPNVIINKFSSWECRLSRGRITYLMCGPSEMIAQDDPLGTIAQCTFS